MTNSNRQIGVVSTTTLVAASMIGAGVYTTSGFTLAALGSPRLVIAAWAVGGVIAICGAIGYGSLANRFAESGGEYLFLSRSLHPVAGMIAGWVSLLYGFTGAIAIAALALEAYMAPILEGLGPSLPRGGVAITAIIAAAVIHSMSIRRAARFQDVVVALKLVMILGIVIVAFRSIGDWQGLREGASGSTPTMQGTGFDFLAFANQLVWISFSYAGFNAAVYVAGEVESPRRNVPIAMVAGTVLVTLIYVVLNAIFVLAPPSSDIVADGHIQQVATTAARSIGGAPFSTFVRLVIVVSLASSVSALVMSGPRVYSKMADDGFLPSWFRFTDRLPIRVIWAQAFLAIVALSITTLKDLLGYLGLTLSVSSALTVSMLFVLRKRGEIERLPMFGVPAGLYVAATALLAGLYGYASPLQAVVVILTLLVGVVLSVWVRPKPS